MAFEFRLPDIGEGLEEAEIVEWLVSPGDVVVRDQPLVEVLTDKASSELPSPVAGTVLRLGASEGDRLNVGEVLIELDDGSAQVADDTEPTKPVASPPSADPVPTPSDAVSRPKASPATRKLALEADVDLGTVTGTGPGGRITSDDVRAAGTHPAPTPQVSSSPPVHTPLGDLGQMPFGRHPLRGVRGVVARNMERSWAEIPHIHSMDEIDASLLVDFRHRLRSMDRPGAAAVTALTVAAAAAARALHRYPMVNATIEGSPGDSIVVHDSVNLGIAVATETGLVVPVVRDVDRLDLFALATAIADLASRGRDGTLTAADLAGATFTITNYGSMGGRWATPIIPPGQAAILGLGAVADRPVVVDGEVVARPTLPIVLGSDHRLIDGDLASAFKGSITADLLEPLNLLVEG
ncbi:MAG: dihydrolipoamide acetyltransferase family protein [Acidimicrobiales bacterium]|jgi:pyruvate dehydrogenase E2 component (dihydrolipoamide acetyltransferase)|nr:dihydrolipoamide acetyltransferase family protein [Acidimicrobiales bacterium]MDP6215123.1 dihydrolipoamide acetyltransferase family protein [Acidimicrobiales bacterium]MDP7208560.1 dihydrolipoamide acetyltransferase family protein [Acidimicrobiales bacterium]HJO99953.1 dihydrolipoamide acetyltransferase family protein [Acidimicrobiales bacterium]|tara:strand:+ start:4886 stop:6112 length:1227 start_codon:yes stop_codon:yes gene_type:complete